MGLHQDIRHACAGSIESIKATANTGAEWAIEQLPRDVALLVDVLERTSAFHDALKCRGITIRKVVPEPKKFA